MRTFDVKKWDGLQHLFPSNLYRKMNSGSDNVEMKFFHFISSYNRTKCATVKINRNNNLYLFNYIIRGVQKFRSYTQ